jgi:N-dimethylarginine dimethylaminohydrolase
MCRPTFFQVRYAINPWMNMKEPVNVAKAQSQWENLRKTIEKAGAEVKVMEPKVERGFLVKLKPPFRARINTQT